CDHVARLRSAARAMGLDTVVLNAGTRRGTSYSKANCSGEPVLEGGRRSNSSKSALAMLTKSINLKSFAYAMMDAWRVTSALRAALPGPETLFQSKKAPPVWRLRLNGVMFSAIRACMICVPWVSRKDDIEMPSPLPTLRTRLKRA